jgi:hypothetical protein
MTCCPFGYGPPRPHWVVWQTTLPEASSSAPWPVVFALLGLSLYVFTKCGGQHQMLSGEYWGALGSKLVSFL